MAKVEAVLKQLYGENTNKEYKLTGSEVLIGRSPKSQVKLECPNVSRKHCILTYSDDGWRISDNKSQNGTYVNGQRLRFGSDLLLQCGDIVFLGPPTEMPQTFSYDICYPEFQDAEPECLLILPAKREHEGNAEIPPKKKASKSKDSNENSNINLPTKSSRNTKSKSSKTNISDKKHQRTVEVSQVPENKNSPVPSFETLSNYESFTFKLKDGDDGGQIYEISSTGNDQVENSESLLNVGNDSVFLQTDTDDFVHLDTPKACSSNGSQNSEKSKESKRLKSELAILNEEISKLQKSRLELLKNYEDVCEKNKVLDLQLAEQAKLQEELKACEIKKAKNEVRSELLEKFEEDLVCQICTELFIQPTILECSHTFCEYCIKQWKKKKNDCPMCRCRIQKMTRVRNLEQFIDKTLNTLTPEQRDKRDQLISERHLAEHASRIKAATPTSRRQRRGRRHLSSRTRRSSINDIQIIDERQILPLDLSPLTFHVSTRNMLNPRIFREFALSDQETESFSYFLG